MEPNNFFDDSPFDSPFDAMQPAYDEPYAPAFDRLQEGQREPRRLQLPRRPGVEIDDSNALIGQRVLRTMYAARKVVIGLDGGCYRPVVSNAAGIVNLAQFKDFGALLTALQGTIAGSSGKVVAQGIAPAAADLTVTLTGAVHFGSIITVSWPFQSGRNGGALLTIAQTIAGTVFTTTLELLPMPIRSRGGPLLVASAAILAATSNAGAGSPAAATQTAVTLAQTDRGWIASTTVITVESLTMRDLSVAVPAA